MRVWIVFDHPEACGVPNNIVDMIHGVFLKRDEAIKCLHGHINIFNMTEGLSLFLNGSAAIDDDGNKFYEIVETQISSPLFQL